MVKLGVKYYVSYVIACLSGWSAAAHEEHLTKGKYKSIAWCAVWSLGHIMVLVTETLILFSPIVIRIQLRHSS